MEKWIVIWFSILRLKVICGQFVHAMFIKVRAKGFFKTSQTSNEWVKNLTSTFQTNIVSVNQSKEDFMWVKISIKFSKLQQFSLNVFGKLSRKSWCVSTWPNSIFVLFFLSLSSQQYFVNGDTLDCGSWEHDFESCVKFEEEKDEEAAKSIIESEAQRRKDRMKAHYGNNVWEKRKSPPEDWNRPLPEHISQKYENSYLDVKSKELKGECKKSSWARAIEKVKQTSFFPLFTSIFVCP